MSRQGDAVLRETAYRIVMCHFDAAGCYGGDRVFFVLPGLNQGNVAVMAQRLRLLVGKSPMAGAQRIIPVTVSLGAAVGRLGQTDVGALVCAADLAL